MKSTPKIYDLSDRKNMFYWQTNRKISPQEQKEIFLDRHRKVNKHDAISAIEYGMKQYGKSSSDSKVIAIGEPIAFGSVNSVLKAKLADGQEVVIRMHPYFVRNGYFWAESIATKKAKELGVPTFETYFIDDTQSKFHFDFMIMQALPGKTMQEYWMKDPELDKQLVRQTGKYTALIHQVKPEGFGFFINKIAKENNKLIGQYDKFSQHIFSGLEEDLVFLAENNVISLKQRRSIEKIFNKNLDLMNTNHGSLIHNDIADWNELTNGKDVTGIIDWDECFAGDPVMEFSAWSLFFDNKRLKFFIEGYKEISPLPDGYKEKDHIFRLRYLISKMHLRKKRLIVAPSPELQEKLDRGRNVMEDEFTYFGV